jgi:hypothetical protein
MNLQTRLNSFFLLKDRLLDKDNIALIQAKATIYNQNSWFLPDFIEKAIEQIATQFLTKEALMEWTAAYPQIADKMTHKKVGIVMAGNIPLVGFHDLLSTLIAGHTAVVKLSSKDTVGMEYIMNTLIEMEPQWKEHIIVQSHLKDCDAYIATGSNNTSRYFEQYFGKYPHIIRSNKTSIAILDGGESTADLDLLADDMMLYFGRGCRNVTQVWVPEGYDFIPLLNALKKYNYIIDEHKYRHNYDYQLALLMMTRQFYMDTNAILLSENPSPFAAIAQIHYQFYTPPQAPVVNPAEIQCIVGKGGLSFGSLQKPSLQQYADGVDTLAFLTSL